MVSGWDADGVKPPRWRELKTPSFFFLLNDLWVHGFCYSIGLAVWCRVYREREFT